MKRLRTGVLALLLALELWGCASPSLPETAPTSVTETSQDRETAVTASAPEETEATKATEETKATGELFLNVSRITFSVVGESEDIYAGSVPRENVTWESVDEGIIQVQDGVLTAVGVGETTVRATWGDQTLTCQAGCLAADRDALMALDKDTLRSPKRYPPEAAEANPFFSDAVFVGDSITYSLFQAETKSGALGHPLFLARGKASIKGFVEYFHSIYYQGVETQLGEAIAASGGKKVFVMLGTNDMGFQTNEEVLANWDTLIDRMREKSPDIEIYFQSCFPEWSNGTGSKSLNEQLATYNQALKEYAEERGYHYINVAAYIEDHTGRMATMYSLDKWVHLNPEGCAVWMQALNAYAYQKEIGGMES